MKGDFTRFTFQPQKHYTSVRMQQGRVQLDADWNEQADLQAYLTQSVAKATIGACGAVKIGGSFEIKPINNTDLLITPGQIYVDGILCELEGTPFTVTEKPQKLFEVKSLYVDGRPLEKEQWVEALDENNQPTEKQLKIQKVNAQNNLLTFTGDVSNINKIRRVITYKTQPDYPQDLQTDTNGTLQEGTYYLAYLDVWQRHITAIEDKNIREVGLNGPDTTTRTKTVWQVKLYELDKLTAEDSCENQEKAAIKLRDKGKKWIERWRNEKANNNRGYLTVNVKDNSQQWENQLYRLEIHKPGQVGSATFKWSRDNGSTVFKIAKIKANEIKLQDLVRDPSPPFTAGQWVEVIDEVRELQGKPGTLVRLTGKTSGNQLFFDPASKQGQDDINESNFSLDNKPKVRRWDHRNDEGESKAEIKITADKEISLDKGIIVNFDPNSSYKTGDYWLIPTRKVKVNYSNIDWPFKDRNTPLPQPPRGIEHHYCPLALLCYDGKKLTRLEDLRETFPSLSNCLDKTEDVMTGPLEIQDNLYVTGKFNEKHQYIPGKVRIGTDQLPGTYKFPEELKQPLARLHVQGISPTSPNRDPIMLLADYQDNTKIIVNSEGYLGIGTSTPHQQLVVNNGGKVGIGYNQVDQSAALAIKGNVGIGTANPDSEAKLEVNGKVKIGEQPTPEDENASEAQLYVQDNTYVNGNFYVTKNAFFPVADNSQVIIGTPQSNHNNTVLEVKGSTTIGSSRVGSSTPKDILLVEGKVNIGDKAPQANTDNQSSPDWQKANAQLYIKGENNAYGAYVDGKIHTTDGLGVGELTSVSPGELKVTQSTFLAIKGGKVGISTEQVHKDTVLGVKGSTTIGSSYVNNKAAPSNGLLVEGKVNIGDKAPQANTDNQSSPDWQKANAQLYIKGENNAYGAYVDGKIHTTGGLGVGELNNQVAPANGLLVEGKINIGSTPAQNNQKASEAQLYVRGDAYVDGEIHFSRFWQLSSQQFKDNITDISIQESLEILEALKPVKYSYKTDQEKKLHAGFIAEQSPDLFTDSDKTMLNSTGIIAILTNVLKEHMHTNSALKHVIAQQQQEIANLRERVRRLETKNHKFPW